MSLKSTKIEAYAQYYLTRFRNDVKVKREALIDAKKKLAIAEKEYSDGKMVTGESDGTPSILRGLLK